MQQTEQTAPLANDGIAQPTADQLNEAGNSSFGLVNGKTGLNHLHHTDRD